MLHHADRKDLSVQKNVFPLAGALLLSVPALHAADWPQWQGPDRTRISKETGLLKAWPAAGRRSSGPRPDLEPAMVQWRSRATASSSRARAAAAASSLRSIVRMARKSGRRRSAHPRRTIADRGRAARRPSTAIGSTCSPRAAIWRASRPMAPPCGSEISSAISAAGSCNG